MMRKLTPLLAAALMLLTPPMTQVGFAQTPQENPEEIASILANWKDNLSLPSRTEYMVTKAFPTILNNPLFPLPPEFNEEVAAVLKLNAFIVSGSNLVQREVLAKQQKLDALLQSSDLLNDALKLPASDTSPSTNTPDLIESALKLSPEQRSILFPMAWDQIIVDTSDRLITVIEKLTNIIPALTPEQFAAFEEALGQDLENLEAGVSILIQASGTQALQSSNSSHDSLMKTLMSAADFLSALIERRAFAVDLTIEGLKSLRNITPQNITFDRQVFTDTVKTGLEVTVVVFGTILTAVPTFGASVPAGATVLARGRIANALANFRANRTTRLVERLRGGTGRTADPTFAGSGRTTDTITFGRPKPVIPSAPPAPADLPKAPPPPPPPTPPAAPPPPPAEPVDPLIANFPKFVPQPAPTGRGNPAFPGRSPGLTAPADVLPKPPPFTPPPASPPPPAPNPASRPGLTPERIREIAQEEEALRARIARQALGGARVPTPPPSQPPKPPEFDRNPTQVRIPAIPEPPAAPPPPEAPAIPAPLVRGTRITTNDLLRGLVRPRPTGTGGGAPGAVGAAAVAGTGATLGAGVAGAAPEPPEAPQPPTTPRDQPDVPIPPAPPASPLPPPSGSQPRRLITVTPSDRIDQGTVRELPRGLPNTTVETGNEPESELPSLAGIGLPTDPADIPDRGVGAAGGAGSGEAGTVFVVLPDGGGFAFGVGPDGQPTGGVAPPIPEGARVSFVPTKGDTSTTTNNEGDGKDKQGGSEPPPPPEPEAPPPSGGGEAPSAEGKGEVGTQGENIRTAQEIHDRAVADAIRSIAERQHGPQSPVATGSGQTLGNTTIPTGEAQPGVTTKPSTAPVDPGPEVSGSGTTGTVSPSTSRDNLIFDPNRASSGEALPFDAREGLDERRGTRVPEDVSTTTTTTTTVSPTPSTTTDKIAPSTSTTTTTTTLAPKTTASPDQTIVAVAPTTTTTTTTPVITENTTLDKIAFLNRDTVNLDLSTNLSQLNKCASGYSFLELSSPEAQSRNISGLPEVCRSTTCFTADASGAPTGTTTCQAYLCRFQPTCSFGLVVSPTSTNSLYTCIAPPPICTQKSTSFALESGTCDFAAADAALVELNKSTDVVPTTSELSGGASLFTPTAGATPLCPTGYHFGSGSITDSHNYQYSCIADQAQNPCGIGTTLAGSADLDSCCAF